MNVGRDEPEFVPPSEEARDQAIADIHDYIGEKAVGLNVEEIIFLADSMLGLAAMVAEEYTEEGDPPVTWDRMYTLLAFTHLVDEAADNGEVRGMGDDAAAE